MDQSNVINAKGAIARHIQWKITLKLAITMREHLSEREIEQIRHFRRCSIGRWLDSNATIPMRENRLYHDLAAKHIAFHAEMERIAEWIAQDRFQEAAEAIQSGSAFDCSSMALAGAITAYNRVDLMVLPA